MERIFIYYLSAILVNKYLANAYYLVEPKIKRMTEMFRIRKS